MDEALELAVGLVRRYPNSAKARIACALCSLDLGNWHDALEIFRDLQLNRGSSCESIRVYTGQGNTSEFEVVLAVTVVDKKPWLD